MWGNLAGRLGATDINATLEKIGNAVAPREDGDDEEYYDDDDVSDDEYDDDEEYEEDYGPGDVMKKVAGASPFRLAGMLTQALDSRHPGTGNSEEIDNNSYTDDNNDTGSNQLFPRESLPIDTEVVDTIDKNGEGNDRAVGGKKGIVDTLQQRRQPVPDPSQLTTGSFESSDNVLSSSITKDSTTETDGFTGIKSMEALPKETPSLNATTTEVKLPSTQTEVKTKIASSAKRSDAVKVNSVKMNQASTGKKSLRMNHEISQRKVAQQPADQKQCRDIPMNVLGVDAPIVPGDKRKGETERIDAAIENPKAENDLPLEGAANAIRNVGAAKGKNQTMAVGKNNDIQTTTNIRAESSIRKPAERPEKKASSSLVDRTKDGQLSKISSENIGQSDDDGADARSAIKASPAKANTSIEKTSQPSPKNMIAIPIMGSESDTQKLLEAPNCRELQTQLLEAKQEIEALQEQAKRDKEKAQSEREDLIAQFHSKETRLLQATSEENQNQTLLLEQEYSAKIQNLENTLENERKESQEEHAEYKRLLRESYSNVDRMEKQLKATVNTHEKEIAQVQQREERALRKVDDRMAQTMAVLDERDEEIKKLKKSIRNMESKVNEHQEGEEEAEEELEELHQENDSLRHTIEKLELEKNNLKEQVAKLKSGSEELPGLQMELTMLKEERNRERTKNQAVMDSAISSRTQLETERDNALSELRDSKQQLAATLGDLEVSRADYSRIVMANDNLQSALEAFQDERRAEMEMIDERRRESEEALKSAHETATSAMKQIHENEMYEVQKAGDNAVKNIMHEMELVEGNFERLKSENNQMRRSLDEAIHRLQTTQEDVIDRDVMKNILLDWCTLHDKSKRHQVLQVMANLLHFSEEEKEKVHLTSKSLDSVRSKVVGALAAPLPPSKADVEHLEGSNVHEKWVSFLMAETDDG